MSKTVKAYVKKNQELKIRLCEECVKIFNTKKCQVNIQANSDKRMVFF